MALDTTDERVLWMQELAQRTIDYLNEVEAIGDARAKAIAEEGNHL